MILTTTITPADIGVALGRPAPPVNSTEWNQWEMWLADALRIIQRRVTDLGADAPSINDDELDYVIREAVATQVRDESTQAPTVGDPAVFKAVRSGPGRVTILGEWWALLGLATTKGKAFSVDLMPPGAGIGGDRLTYWWAP